ncbi:MAG TPA: TMEM175 family protein [Streptosporangiaceae bacterium]|nr:TMEM175 family protein [Streptosporangiaceae bacterium]
MGVGPVIDSRRAEAFSDGVFAVAITVLVFNLIPIAKPGIRVHELLGGWPQYVSYVVSFLTIGIVWLNHHSMLSRLHKVDRAILVLNLLMLMAVVAIPFPTVLVADNLGPGSTDQGARLATVVYGLVMIAMSIGFSGMWVYLSTHQHLIARPLRSPLQAWIRFSAGLVGYVAATLIAFVSPKASLAIYGVIAVYYLFENLPDPEAEVTDGERPAGAGAEAGAGDRDGAGGGDEDSAGGADGTGGGA